MGNGTNTSAGLSYGVENSGILSADADAALVGSAQQGDLNAFETLVVKYQKRMLNIAFRMIGDYDEACEVVQDAFLSAHKNIRTFRGDSKFTTWLTTIILNLSRNRLKQVRARQSHEAYSLDEPIRTGEGEMTVDPPSKEPSTLDCLETRDIRAAVRNCIDALEPDFREVIVLRDLQEHSYDEIGAMLSVAAGTVKSRLFRARNAVKDCLKKTLGER